MGGWWEGGLERGVGGGGGGGGGEGGGWRGRLGGERLGLGSRNGRGG